MRKIRGQLTISISLLTLFFCGISFTGCTNNEPKRETEVIDDGLFAEYDINGDEERGYMTIRAQFRAGGPQGRAVALAETGSITFDGEELLMDSSRMNGAWYELFVPVAKFPGSHTLVFTDAEGKQYPEEFQFEIISLNSDLPALINRDSLKIELKGLDRGDQLSILFTDTSFYGRGLERIDTVEDGNIVFKRHELNNLANGPVTIEFIKEFEEALRDPMPLGGRLTISYGIRRVVELGD